MNQIVKKNILKLVNGSLQNESDSLAVEEPLEIRLSYFDDSKIKEKNISVTMRTPGNDEELALGFLFTEGLIHDTGDVTSIKKPSENIIVANLEVGVPIDFSRLERNFYTTSSCGVCGKTSIEAIAAICREYPEPKLIKYKKEFILSLPPLLRMKQDVFENTGALHASALFNREGKIILLREDVGRHNALDKVIGAAFMQNLVPLQDYMLLLSGRASFELIQKAKMGGIKIIAAIGAPSSLAVELAREGGMTLIGFLNSEKFNVYCGEERIEI